MFFHIKDKDKEYWQTLTNTSMLGIHLVSNIIVGLAIGYFLDKWLGTGPWLLLVFLLLGIAAGFKTMFQEAKKIHDASNAKKPQSKD